MTDPAVQAARHQFRLVARHDRHAPVAAHQQPTIHGRQITRHGQPGEPPTHGDAGSGSPPSAAGRTGRGSTSPRGWGARSRRGRRGRCRTTIAFPGMPAAPGTAAKAHPLVNHQQNDRGPVGPNGHRHDAGRSIPHRSHPFVSGSGAVRPRRRRDSAAVLPAAPPLQTATKPLFHVGCGTVAEVRLRPLDVRQAVLHVADARGRVRRRD